MGLAARFPLHNPGERKRRENHHYLHPCLTARRPRRQIPPRYVDRYTNTHGTRNTNYATTRPSDHPTIRPSDYPTSSFIFSPSRPRRNREASPWEIPPRSITQGNITQPSNGTRNTQ